MGWPDGTKDLRAFYPTSLLNTGFDILFFWVARMIMLGIEMTGDVPFRQVYIHGLVRDADKQKMSKTKGNVIDPIEMTEKHGTDAVRFALVVAAGQGSDVVMSEERVAAARDFANKIWNAARFVFMSLERAGAEPWIPDDTAGYVPEASQQSGKVPLADRWMFSRLNQVAKQANEYIEKFRYHEAANLLYHFFWGEFCDWYIELKKLTFGDNTGLTPEWRNMLAAMERALRLLQPLMPFITEELWQRLTINSKNRAKSIALTAYPEYRPEFDDQEAEQQVAALQGIVTAVRNLRAEMNVAPKTELRGTLHARAEEVVRVVREQADVLLRLANVKLDVEIGAAPRGKAMHHGAGFDLMLQLPAGEANVLRERLGKQLQPLEKARDSSKRQLASEEFVSKAPGHVVDSIRKKLGDYESQIERIRATLDSLS
jgi:valyl-tRNA synthetase